MKATDISGVGIMHYSAPPVVGGVEAVMYAHAAALLRAGREAAVIAGRGEQSALPPGTGFALVPEMDTQNPRILQAGQELEQGRVPAGFEGLVDHLTTILKPLLAPLDGLIVHNIFGKHFNLALTAALFRLLDEGLLPRCIAWGHDFTWTSPNSRAKVHAGYPWDLLRSDHPGLTHVTVSRRRQEELAGLLGCPPEQIKVIYNGVDPQTLLGLSDEGLALVERLGLLDSDLTLLMPVRVTQAKNIEAALHLVAALKTRGLHPRLVVTGPPDPHDEGNMAYFRSLQELRKRLGVEQEARFVYEAGPERGQAYQIEAPLVGELFRVSDVMFMPSHREGFGMPVLEAGLAGLPVATTRVPAAVEIAGREVLLFEPDEDPDALAERILSWVEGSPVHRLRRRVRQEYTWEALFRREIEPLLQPAGRPA